MKKINKGVGILLLVLSFVGCNATTNTTSTATTGLKLTMAADFSKAAALVESLTAADCGGQTPPTTSDSPSFAAGVDCDADGGIVSFITPSKYSIAIKRASLVKSDGTLVDLISDTGTLVKSQVVDFTSAANSKDIITLSPSSLKAGSYSGIRAEIYYFQMTFPVAGVIRNVRIYMSDDDFPAEGSLGHHQGDITLVNDSGTTELGWVGPSWSDAGLTTTRGAPQNGAGEKDTETGHDRGFFGDKTLWNAADFTQGASQDIYKQTLGFPATLSIPDITTITSLTAVTMTFSVANSWYYEDFAPQGTGFFPGVGGEAAGVGAEWAPLVPVPGLSVK